MKSIGLTSLFFIALLSYHFYICLLDPSGSIELLFYFFIPAIYYCISLLLYKKIKSKVAVIASEIIFYVILVYFYNLQKIVITYNADHFLFKKFDTLLILFLAIGLFYFLIFRFTSVVVGEK
jgi:hypothetical protein